MKSLALPFLLALGFSVPPALSQTDDPARAGSDSGYGFSSGGPNGMRSEAGADLEIAQLDMPQPQTRGDVTYMCGGIGETEARFMNQQARDYDLKVTFASQTGAYLADVDVDIRGPRGESVLQTHCGAPILLVDLPRSGTYRIEADASGFEQARTVRVTKGRQTASAVVAWPQRVVAQMEPEIEPATTGASGATSGGVRDPDMEQRMQSGGERPGGTRGEGMR